MPVRTTIIVGLISSLFVSSCGDKTTTADTSSDTTPADTSPDVLDDTTADTADTTADTSDTVDGQGSLVVPCGASSAAALAACVESGRIGAALTAFEGARPTGTAKHTASIADLETRLAALGYTVERDDYGRGVNIIGTRLGKTAPDELVVVSAHFDSVANCPGADDNASGVAGALEAARVLATADHDRTLVVALWDEEEKGLLGAFDWTDRLARSGGKVVVSFVFEMIGFASSEPNTQTLPDGFEVLFADAVAQVEANQKRGDFIALIADASSAPHTAAMAAMGQALSHPTLPLNVPAALLSTSLINDLRRSDHAAFWAHGWPAMMITDTANFRNLHYHCGTGADVSSDLDMDFARNTVAITVYAAALALDQDGPGAATPPTPAACDLVAQTGCTPTQKCTIDGGGAVLYQPACRNVPTEAAADGEACTRPGNIPGEDTCGKGLFCTFWGLPAGSPQARWCRRLCVADTDCASGDRCQSFVGPAPGSGVCIPGCDPFADTCPENAHCIGERAATDRSAAFGCARVGPTALGAECGSRNDGCVAGAMCTPSSSDGVERCAALCDATHPCPEGQACEPLPNPHVGASPGLGTCH